MIGIKDQTSYLSNKIKKEEELKLIISELKQQGKKIGLCVGGFDLLHPGHMTHLGSAKKYCDVLIIGITADIFNSKRKGKGRPIYPEHLRVFSISQLNPVDYVFLSNYEKAIDPILNLKPDFYIKGPDYKDKQTPGIVAEREAISSVGGEMRYTDDEKLSTTDIVNYIKENVEWKSY